MKETLLAIDDFSLPFKKNVGIYLSKPKVLKEPVLRPSPVGSGAPDDAATHFYGTVIYDDGIYRMWYYASHWGINHDWPPKMMQQIKKATTRIIGKKRMFIGPLCYAESDDGINFKKPNLGQVLFKGNKNNNALALPHAIVSAATVIKDVKETDPLRRYKMVYQFFPEFSDPSIEEYGTKPSIAIAISEDGLKWNVINIPFKNQFVEHSSFIKHNNQYIVHYHAMGTFAGHYSEGGSPCGRTGMVRISPDFKYWPDIMAEAFAPKEPEKRELRGQSGIYDQVHLGVGATSFGNVCIGLYGLWHNAEFDKNFGEISCDLGLLVSNDGIHFREPVKGYRYIKRNDSLATKVKGHNFNTILCQANGILNVGDKTLIYHGRWRNVSKNEPEELRKHYSAEVALATLPRDRFGSLRLNPNELKGSICSAPITLPENNCKAVINAEGLNGITVQILDKDFKTIKGFDQGKASEKSGLDCVIKWSKHKLKELSGETVRIFIYMKKINDISPRVYAIYVDGEKS
ncbi:MAG: hypothetical protein KAG94_01915 [Clostridiales bacterium]|nr:hypothetical protein [Clostridiales bacterium]